VSARVASLQLLTRYVLGVLDSDLLAAPHLADAVVRHVVELIVLSMRPTCAEVTPGGQQSIRAARLTALKADIDRHLTSNTLNIATRVTRHGITPRYLHMPFEGEGQTYSQFVLVRTGAETRCGRRDSHTPVTPSAISRRMPIWPLCRAVSSIKWTRIHRNVTRSPVLIDRSDMVSNSSVATRSRYRTHWAS